MLQSLRRWYSTAAMILLSSLLLLALINFAVIFAHFGRAKLLGGARYVPPLDKGASIEKFYALYPRRTRDEVNQLMGEIWTRRFAYRPYTEFKEAPYRGRFVNITEDGRRYTSGKNENHESFPENAVWVFGGSTTFGYGVEDSDTIVSHLSRELRNQGNDDRCINFGAGYFYSTQERILFQQLLQQGKRPRRVVFIDGLNDLNNHRDIPDNMRILDRAMVSQGSGFKSFADFLAALPMNRAVSFLASKVNSSGGPRNVAGLSPEEDALAKRLIDRYLENRRQIEAIANAYNIPVLFVWQPVPTYHFDLSKHLFSERLENFKFHEPTYDALAKINQKKPLSNFLWLADIHQEVGEGLYVDAVHYSPRFSAEIARRIAAAIQ